MTVSIPKKNNTFLVFNQTGNKLFAYFLKKNFSHVFIVRKHKRGWVVIDPCQRNLKTDVVSPKFDLIGFYSKQGFNIIGFHVPKHEIEDKAFIPRFMPILTCVTLAKYAIKFKYFAITPWQLYKQCERIKLNERK